jgi:uncharacterized membrane protein
MSETNEPLLRPVMPELDSIRGVALLAVLLYHGFSWSANLAVFPHSLSASATALTEGPALLFAFIGVLAWTTAVFAGGRRRSWLARP